MIYHISEEQIHNIIRLVRHIEDDLKASTYETKRIKNILKNILNKGE